MPSIVRVTSSIAGMSFLVRDGGTVGGMAQLPINFHKLLSAPPGSDAYRWRVWLEEDVPLLVELSGPEASRTGLGRHELDAALPAALQRFAAGRLRDDVPVLDQTNSWEGPLVLTADCFR